MPQCPTLRGAKVLLKALLGANGQPDAPSRGVENGVGNGRIPPTIQYVPGRSAATLGRGEVRIALAPQGKYLGNLHSIERGALEELIADNKKRKGPATAVAGIAPQTSHEDVAPACSLEWHRKVVLCDIVDDSHARRGRKNLARPFDPRRLLELKAQRDRVCTQYGYANAGHTDRELRQGHDLLEFAHDLDFFLV
jgi:hypothetical protein